MRNKHCAKFEVYPTICRAKNSFRLLQGGPKVLIVGHIFPEAVSLAEFDVCKSNFHRTFMT